MAIIPAGKKIRVTIIPGYLSPGNPGTRDNFYVHGYLPNSASAYSFVTPSGGALNFPIDLLIDLFTGPEVYQPGKVLCTVEWDNTYGERIQWELKWHTSDRQQTISTVKNLFTQETVFEQNDGRSFLVALQYWKTQNQKTCYIGWSKWKDYTYTPNPNDSLAVFAWCEEGEKVNPSFANPVQQTSAWAADSEGNAAAKALYRAFEGLPVDDTDLGDDSTPAGGGGGFEYVDDNIEFPDLPTDTALASELVCLYHMDSGTVTALARELWSQNFFDNILKNYDSPFENILALNILPVAVTGTNANVYVGNFDTSLTAERITTQFVDLDGGTCSIPKIFGNQLDFAPASTAQIFIPFMGYKDLDLDDLSGGTATLKYRLDLLTGNLLAMLKITQTDRYAHNSHEYEWGGNCASSIPLSGANYMTMYSNIINGALSTIGMASSGNIIGAAGGVSSIMTSKPQYMRSGNISGNMGFMGQLRAFILLSSPVSSIPGNIKKIHGVRSNIYMAFSGLTGLQQIQDWRPNTTLTSVCTKEELEEIDKLLKEGVIF